MLLHRLEYNLDTRQPALGAEISTDTEKSRQGVSSRKPEAYHYGTVLIRWMDDVVIPVQNNFSTSIQFIACITI